MPTTCEVAINVSLKRSLEVSEHVRIENAGGTQTAMGHPNGSGLKGVESRLFQKKATALLRCRRRGIQGVP
jgi:hypothetical protein